MAIELIRPEQEATLVSLAKKANGIGVVGGEDPTEVVTQLAKQSNLTPPMVERLCQALNISRSMNVFKQADERLSDFPLADASEVLRRLFSDEEPVEKAAQWYENSVPDYTERQYVVEEETPAEYDPFQKEAEAPFKQDREPIQELYDSKNKLEQLINHQRIKYATQRELFTQSLHELDTFFRKYPERFSEVESKSPALFGKTAALIMDLVYKTGTVRPFVKRGERVSGPVAVEQDLPYQLIKKAVNVGQKTLLYGREHHRLRADADKINALIKDSFAFGDATFGFGLDRLVTQAAKANAERPIDLIENPQHEAELAGIDAVTTLHDIMNNDEVISEADQDEVVDVYNQLVSSAPDLANQPFLLRSAIRKAIQQGGALEPFEIKQMVETIEKARQSQPSVLKEQIGLEQAYKRPDEKPESPRRPIDRKPRKPRPPKKPDDDDESKGNSGSGKP